MRYLFLIFLIGITGACESQTIISCSKNDYLKGTENTHLLKDESIKIYKDRIILKKRYILENNSSEEDFYNYKYKGSFGIKLNYIVIEKEHYNGSTFFILDKQKKYAKYDIQGQPYLFKDLIISINIEETTDNQNVLNIYRISNELVFIKKIDLNENIIVKDIRVKNSEIYLNDSNNKFWKIIPAPQSLSETKNNS
jgi:hypothetical protein